MRDSALRQETHVEHTCTSIKLSWCHMHYNNLLAQRWSWGRISPPNNAQPSPAAREGYTDSQNHKWQKKWQQGRNQNGELNTCRQKLVPKRMAIPEKSPQTNRVPSKIGKRRMARLGSTGRWRSIVPGKTCGDVRKTNGKIPLRSCFHFQSHKLDKRRKWVTQHSACEPTGVFFLDRAGRRQRASAMYWLRSGSCWQRSSASNPQIFCEKLWTVSSFPTQKEVG